MPSTFALLACALSVWPMAQSRPSNIMNLMRRAPPTKPSFSFSFESPPSQCNGWNLKIDGGKPPFSIIVVATEVNSEGHIVKLPVSVDGKAPYQGYVPFAQPQGIEVIAIMSDADGFGTGGVTAPMRVQNSTDASCLGATTDTFWWATEPEIQMPQDKALITPIKQCQEVTLTWEDPENDHAKPPFDVFGVIPGGESWVIANATTARNVTTVANVAADETFIWMVFGNDQKQYGGNIMYKVQGGNSSCMGTESPTTTSNPIAPLGASTSAASSGAADAGGTGKGHSNIGKTVGPIVGVVGAAIIGAIAFLWWWRKRRSSKGGIEAGGVDLAENKDDLHEHRHDHPAVPITPFTGLHHRTATSTNVGTTFHGHTSPVNEKGAQIPPINRNSYPTPSSTMHSQGPPSRPAQSPLRIEHEEDAGSFPMPQERVEKLPPTYNPNWLAPRNEEDGSSVGQSGITSPESTLPSHKREVLQEKHRYME